MRFNWRLVLGIVISLGMLVFILKDVSLSELWAELSPSKANYLWLLPTTAIMIVSLWLRALRWRALLDGRLSAARSFHVSNVANLLNNVLPFRLGELSKAYLSSRDSPVTAMQGLSVVLIERLLDVLSVFGYLIVVLPFAPRGGLIVSAGLTLAVVAFVGVVGLFAAAALREKAMAAARALTGWLPQSLREALLTRGDDFLRGVSAAGGKRLAAAIFWSILLWLGFGSASYTLLLIFDPTQPFYVGIFVTCALALGQSLPSAPANVGLYEAAAMAGLAVFGIPENTGLAYGLTSHIYVFILVAVFGVVGLDREGESFGHITAAAQKMVAAARNK